MKHPNKNGQTARAVGLQHETVADALIGRLPETGFIRKAQLIPFIIPFSNTTLWRKVKAGEFPAPIKISARVTAWRAEEVRAWMQAQAA